MVNIFLDESGSFVNAANSGSWNSIAAYMSPECDRRHLQGILENLKRSVGVVPKAEIKLKHLNEEQYLQFLKQLSHLNGVVFVVATDAGLNQPPDVAEHQRIQAEKIVEYKEKMHYQAAREGLQALSDQVAALAPQLYIQLHCQVNLIAAVIRNGVLYFVQRHPRSLGHFRWRIDQKNSTRSDYEKAFASITPAILQSISLQEPMPMLIGADYSAFSRFDYSADEYPTYLRDTYGIEIREDAPVTNIGLIMRENHKFVDSTQNYGVQIADLLASGVRRCLRQEFGDNESVARLLGTLMAQNYGGRPPIQFLGFSRQKNFVGDQVTRLSRIMGKYSRAMLSR